MNMRVKNVQIKDALSDQLYLEGTTAESFQKEAAYMDAHTEIYPLDFRKMTLLHYGGPCVVKNGGNPIKAVQFVKLDVNSHKLFNPRTLKIELDAVRISENGMMKAGAKCLVEDLENENVQTGFHMSNDTKDGQEVKEFYFVSQASLKTFNKMPVNDPKSSIERDIHLAKALADADGLESDIERFDLDEDDADGGLISKWTIDQMNNPDAVKIDDYQPYDRNGHRYRARSLGHLYACVRKAFPDDIAVAKEHAGKHGAGVFRRIVGFFSKDPSGRYMDAETGEELRTRRLTGICKEIARFSESYGGYESADTWTITQKETNFPFLMPGFVKTIHDMYPDLPADWDPCLVITASDSGAVFPAVDTGWRIKGKVYRTNTFRIKKSWLVSLQDAVEDLKRQAEEFVLANAKKESSTKRIDRVLRISNFQKEVGKKICEYLQNDLSTYFKENPNATELNFRMHVADVITSQRSVLTNTEWKYSSNTMSALQFRLLGALIFPKTTGSRMKKTEDQPIFDPI